MELGEHLGADAEHGELPGTSEDLDEPKYTQGKLEEHDPGARHVHSKEEHVPPAGAPEEAGHRVTDHRISKHSSSHSLPDTLQQISKKKMSYSKSNQAPGWERAGTCSSIPNQREG